MSSLIRNCKVWGLWRNFHRGLMPQSLEDIDIVFNICSRGRPITVNKLVDSCIASRNTVLRHLRVLIDNGIIAMNSSAGDRRFRELSLTRKGVGLVHRATSSLRKLGAAIRMRR